MTKHALHIFYEIHLEAAPGSETALSKYIQLLPALMTEYAECSCRIEQRSARGGWAVSLEWASQATFRRWICSPRIELLDHLFAERLIGRFQVICPSACNRST